MQKVTYSIELDTKIYKPQNDIILKQYDIDSTLFIIKIVEADGTYHLSGSSVEIIFTKPDGTYTMKTQLEENSPLTIVQNNIHCLVPQSALTVIGSVNCEVIIRGAEGEKLTTRRFGFYVDSILLTESVALSDNNVHVLDGLISQVNGLLGDVENAISGYSQGWVFEQMVASDTWIIDHPLNKYPALAIVDTGGNLVGGDVLYESTSRIIVTYNYEFSGRAYLT